MCLVTGLRRQTDYSNLRIHSTTRTRSYKRIPSTKRTRSSEATRAIAMRHGSNHQTRASPCIRMSQHILIREHDLAMPVTRPMQIRIESSWREDKYAFIQHILSPPPPAQTHSLRPGLYLPTLRHIQYQRSLRQSSVPQLGTKTDTSNARPPHKRTLQHQYYSARAGNVEVMAPS